MAKYRVLAECVSYLHLDVEADSPEEAYEIALDTDGGDFVDENDGEFNISPEVLEWNDDSKFYQ